MSSESHTPDLLFDGLGWDHYVAVAPDDSASTVSTALPTIYQLVVDLLIYPPK